MTWAGGPASSPPPSALPVCPVNPRACFAVCLLACLPALAHAYVDPGTGMLLWQGLIAAIGAVLVFMRNPWQALKRLFERIFRR